MPRPTRSLGGGGIGGVLGGVASSGGGWVEAGSGNGSGRREGGGGGSPTSSGMFFLQAGRGVGANEGIQGNASSVGGGGSGGGGGGAYAAPPSRTANAAGSSGRFLSSLSPRRVCTRCYPPAFLALVFHVVAVLSCLCLLRLPSEAEESKLLMPVLVPCSAGATEGSILSAAGATTTASAMAQHLSADFASLSPALQLQTDNERATQGERVEAAESPAAAGGSLSSGSPVLTLLQSIYPHRGGVVSVENENKIANQVSSSGEGRADRTSGRGEGGEALLGEEEKKKIEESLGGASPSLASSPSGVVSNAVMMATASHPGSDVIALATEFNRKVVEPMAKAGQAVAEAAVNAAAGASPIALPGGFIELASKRSLADGVPPRPTLMGFRRGGGGVVDEEGARRTAPSSSFRQSSSPSRHILRNLRQHGNAASTDVSRSLLKPSDSEEAQGGRGRGERGQERLIDRSGREDFRLDDVAGGGGGRATLAGSLTPPSSSPGPRDARGEGDVRNTLPGTAFISTEQPASPSSFYYAPTPQNIFKTQQPQAQQATQGGLSSVFQSAAPSSPHQQVLSPPVFSQQSEAPPPPPLPPAAAGPPSSSSLSAPSSTPPVPAGPAPNNTNEGTASSASPSASSQPSPSLPPASALPPSSPITIPTMTAPLAAAGGGGGQGSPPLPQQQQQQQQSPPLGASFPTPPSSPLPLQQIVLPPQPFQVEQLQQGDLRGLGQVRESIEQQLQRLREQREQLPVRPTGLFGTFVGGGGVGSGAGGGSAGGMGPTAESGGGGVGSGGLQGLQQQQVAIEAELRHLQDLEQQVKQQEERALQLATAHNQLVEEQQQQQGLPQYQQPLVLSMPPPPPPSASLARSGAPTESSGSPTTISMVGGGGFSPTATSDFLFRKFVREGGGGGENFFPGVVAPPQGPAAASQEASSSSSPTPPASSPPLVIQPAPPAAAAAGGASSSSLPSSPQQQQPGPLSQPSQQEGGGGGQSPPTPVSLPQSAPPPPSASSPPQPPQQPPAAAGGGGGGEQQHGTTTENLLLPAGGGGGSGNSGAGQAAENNSATQQPSAPQQPEAQPQGTTPPSPAPPPSPAVVTPGVLVAPVAVTSECQVDVSACGGNEKAIAKAKEYAQKVPAAHCPCQQMLVVLACNLIQNQNNLASQGQAKLDTPEASTLTLTLTGATCTALKGACPAVSPEVLLATRLPTVPEQTGAAAAAAASTAPVQLQTKETLGGTAGGGGAGVYVQQGEQQQLQQAGGGSVLEKSQGVSSSSFLQFAQSSAHRDLLRGRGGGGGGPPGKEVAEGLRERRAENRADGEGAPTPPASFLQVRADLEGDVRLMGLARAAAKLGAKTTEELMNQVRLQEKVQREAMEAVMDLIQVKEPATTSSFLGEATKSGVWVFATSPEEQCRDVSPLIPVPIPVDVEDRRMMKVVVQATDGEAQALALTPSSPSPPASS